MFYLNSNEIEISEQVLTLKILKMKMINTQLCGTSFFTLALH